MGERFFRLSTVARRIEALLEPALQTTFWVKAEIASGRLRGGIFRCELVETAPNGRVVARMRAVIWREELERIERVFREAGLELTLDDGAVVGLRCRLQFHAQYGLSLAGLDMDPAVALGELELARRRILERLTADGLLDRNARLPVPVLPQSIALVTSRESAAYRDFVATLQTSGHGFRIFVADTPVQGADTRAGVLYALESVARLPVDLVVIARGGGSRLDLAALDDESIARRIAALLIPVWTGIGHETDTSVLDAVAGAAFKTPTAVAEELVARAARVGLRKDEAAVRLQSVWRLRCGAEQRLLAESANGLRQGTRKLLEFTRSALSGRAHALDARVKGRLAQTRQRLESGRHVLRSGGAARLADCRRELGERGVALVTGTRHRLQVAGQRQGFLRARLLTERVRERLRAEARALGARSRVLRAHDPRRNLERGFALVYADDGRLMRSVGGVVPGDATRTELADGRILGTVTEVRKGEGDGDGEV